MELKKYQGAGIQFWRTNRDGTVEVLLGRRSSSVHHAPGEWSSFGGGRDVGESPWQNAVREAKEETAHRLADVDFRAPDFLVSAKSPRRVLVPFMYDFSTFFVEVKREPEGWPRLNWEHSEARWFDLKSLPTPLHPQTKAALRHWKWPQTTELAVDSVHQERRG